MSSSTPPNLALHHDPASFVHFPGPVIFLFADGDDHRLSRSQVRIFRALVIFGSLKRSGATTDRHYLTHTRHIPRTDLYFFFLQFSVFISSLDGENSVEIGSSENIFTAVERFSTLFPFPIFTI